MLFFCHYGYTFRSHHGSWRNLLTDTSTSIPFKCLLLRCKRILVETEARSLVPHFSEFCFTISVKVETAWTPVKSWSLALSSFVVWETKKPKLNIYKNDYIWKSLLSKKKKKDTHQRCSFSRCSNFLKILSSYLHQIFLYVQKCMFYLLQMPKD